MRLSVFAILALVSIVTLSTTAAGVTTVTAYLDPTNQAVDVSPDGDGMAVFDGTVVLTDGTASTTVTLSGSCTHGGSLTVSPATIVLDPGNPEGTFNATVQIPPGTSSTYTPVVTVSGTWTGGNVPEVQATVTVTQFYDMRVSCDDPEKGINASGNTTFQVKLNNLGNGDETITLAVENQDELLASGVFVSFGYSSLTVPEKYTKTATVYVTTGPETPSGLYTLGLLAASETLEGNVSGPLSLAVRVNNTTPPVATDNHTSTMNDTTPEQNDNASAGSTDYWTHDSQGPDYEVLFCFSGAGNVVLLIAVVILLARSRRARSPPPGSPPPPEP